MDAKRAAAATATSRAYAQGNIAGLDDAMTRRLIASTVYTESNGGDLEVTNRQGYVGRYQAGAQWLADAGYVDGDRLREAMKGFRSEWAWAKAGKMTRFLEDSANWKKGLDLEQYKASASLQDEAFKRNSDVSFIRAVEEGLLHLDDDPKRIAGFLKARHIAGYGGARAVLQGKIPRSDSNGTSNYDYYDDIAKNRDGLDQVIFDNALPPRVSSRESDDRSERVLQRGADGHAVRDLQRFLHQLGFPGRDGQPLRIDGNFGANTESAVRAFQRDHGLRVDGVAGKETLRVLVLTQANPFEDKAHPQHALYAQALRGVHAEEDHRRVPHGRHSENLAGALTAAAANAGLVRIDRVELNVDGSRARAVQVHPLRDEPGLNRVTMAVETHVVVQAPKQANIRQDNDAGRHAVQPTPQQTAAQQSASRQATPQQATPQQATPQQATPQQVAPQQLAPQQPAPQQAAPQQAAPQQAAPQQLAPQQLAPQQLAPQQAAPSHTDEVLAVPAPRHHARAVR